MLNDILRQAFAVLVIFAAGLIVFYVVVREPQQYSRLERVAYFWPLGLTALAMPMFLMLLAGMHLSATVIAGLVITVGVIARLIRGAHLRDYWRGPSASQASTTPLTKFEWFMIVIIVACLGARTLDSFLTPMYDWDGVCTWGVKAKILFFSTLRGGWDYFHKAEFRCTNQKYPLLWPLMYTWVCSVLGRWDDRAMCVINPVNLVAFITIMYHAMRRIVSRPVALAVAAVAASLPAVLHYAECVQADVPLMLMNGASLCALLAWIQHRRRESILLVAILLDGAMFTKQDGRIIFLAQICVAGASIVVGSSRGERKTLWLHLGMATLIAIIYITPWMLYERTVPIWTQYYRPLSLSTIRWRELPAFIQMVTENLVHWTNGVHLTKWNFLWPIVGLFLLSSRAPWRYPMNYVLGVFLLHLVGLSIVLLAFTYPFTLSAWEFALERFTLTMIPPVWLLLAKCVDEWWDVWKAR